MANRVSSECKSHLSKIPPENLAQAVMFEVDKEPSTEKKVKDFLDNWAGMVSYFSQDDTEFPERNSENVRHLFKDRCSDSLALHNWVALAGYQGRQVGGSFIIKQPLVAKAYHFLSLHKRDMICTDYSYHIENGIPRRVDAQVKGFHYKWLMMDQQYRACTLVLMEDLMNLPSIGLQAKITYNSGKIDDLYLPSTFLYTKIFHNHLQGILERTPNFDERRREIPRQFLRFL